MRTNVKAAASVLVILTVLGLWAWKTLTAQGINPILYAVVVIYALAAAYVVFGKKAVDDAIDTYQELRGDGEEDNGGEG